ncbi:MAG: 30S ribosomal protein S3 [Methanomicrobia archaeon]|nr:30S ribosomal protein S3 [Methanomicrobia archaeon]
MVIERKIVEENLKNTSITEYLAKYLERAGYGGVEIKRSPLGTRIIVKVETPGLVIGRKGRSIRELTRELGEKFSIENPQIEVEEIKNPELNADVMAHRTASDLERGYHYRRTAYKILRRIMDAGAKGAEIVISGKLSGERSRTARFTTGYLKKCGEPAQRLVRRGYAIARLKLGVMGVTVKIMPPDVVLPDEIYLIEEKEDKGEDINIKEEVKEEMIEKPQEVKEE